MLTVGFKKGGADYIDAEIAKAIEDGCRTAKITGCWEIDRAVRLPSNITLILENCHLRMADGVFSNMFLNEHYGTEITITRCVTDNWREIDGVLRSLERCATIHRNMI